MNSDLSERLQKTLGDSYKIERELGGGGMSRVYVAEESELGRKIVIKVLPPDLAAGLNVERFRREIQMAAKLQHPHIVPLLSAGAKDGLLYFTMPFITGESLRTRITRQHELPVHDAVRILRDVVDALAYAHANGVVHRDIKPDNVLLSGNHAVVTDFGVSKALSNSTGTSNLTSIGVALGTPAYMSPEQAAADPNVDHRADIYSVGALAYELLTGRQVFVAPTPQQVLSAHIQERPEPVSKHRSAVSPALEALVMKCLEKKPADRWQSAEQLLSALEPLSTPSGGMTPQPMQPVSAKKTPWALIAAGVVMLALGGIIAFMASRGSSAETIGIGATNQVTNTPGLELDPALSPDGKVLAYAAGQPGRMRIQVRQIAGGRVIELSTGLSGEHRLPQWSPDGSRVLFLAAGQIYSVPAFGGVPTPIGKSGTAGGVGRFVALGVGIGAAWSPDGKLVAHTLGDSILISSVEGGSSRTVLVHTSPHSLAWSPDGRRLAFVSQNPQFAYGGTGAFGNLGPNSIWTVSIDGGTAVRMTTPGALYASPVWMPDSRELLYVSNVGGARDVYAQRIDGRGSPGGTSRRLTTGLGAHGISLSRDATRLAYSVLQYRTNIYSAPIGTGVTPASAITQITDENQAVEGIGVTPDGKWLVYDSNRGGNSDIYKVPVSGGEPVQLTKDPADDFIPQWSRDGKQVVFHSWRTGNRDVFVMNADGADLSRVTTDTIHDMYPDFAADGKHVVYYHGTNVTTTMRSAGGLFVSERGNDGQWSAERPLLSGQATMARWTHDGRLVTFISEGGLKVIDAAGGTPRTLITNAQLGNALNSTAVGPDPSVVYARAVDSSGVHSFYAVDRASGKTRMIMRLSDPRRRARRHEFATDSKRLFFTLSEDESDIWVTELRKP